MKSRHKKALSSQIYVDLLKAHLGIFPLSVQASLCFYGMCHWMTECDNLPWFNLPLLDSVSYTEASCGQ